MFEQAKNPVIRADGRPNFALCSTLAGAAVTTVIGQIVIAALAAINNMISTMSRNL